MLPDLSLAQKLARLRGERSLSEIARGAGTTPSTLSRMEQGRHDQARSPQSRTLRGETLRRLASFYGVLPEYLTGDLRTYMRTWAAAVLANPMLQTPGERLREVVKELGGRYSIKTNDVAEELGLDSEDLGAYVAGLVPFAQESLAALEAATGVPAEWVVYGAPGNERNSQPYGTSVEMARRAGMPPSVLEELVKAWLAKNGTRK